MAAIRPNFRFLTGTGSVSKDGDFPVQKFIQNENKVIIIANIIKISIMQAVPAQMLLSEGTLVDAATFLPIELNGRIVRSQTVSIVELGKRLLRAAREGNTEQVRELMGKGAPFTTDWLGTSPLHFAALNNHLETCQVLLRAGISRDSRTKVDRTPLHMAAYEGHLSIVEVLLSNGADVDARDMLKMTPLHWAVQNSHADVVTLLLRHGANANVINKFDKSPTDIALETNRLDIMQLLQVITKDVMEIDATEALSIEMENENNEFDDKEEDDCNKQAEYLIQDDTEDDVSSKLPESLDVAQMEAQQEHTSNADLTDSMQMLKEHGISFLPVDNSSVVASAVENGHSLVLTEVGKQVLKSTKPLMNNIKMRMPVQKTQIAKLKGRQVITLTPDQLLAMANSSQTQQTNRIPIIFNGSEKPMKRIVMNKNKIIFSGTPNQVPKKLKSTDTRTPEIELMSRQLAEARREAEEYKQMLKRKEAEAERYKRQLQSITQAK